MYNFRQHHCIVGKVNGSFSLLGLEATWYHRERLVTGPMALDTYGKVQVVVLGLETQKDTIASVTLTLNAIR
jgi:hypothetical protein